MAGVPPGGSLKIALSGAHGTGKTTLLGELSATLKESSVISQQLPEIPRRICEVAKDEDYYRRGNNTILRQLTLLIVQPVLESVSARAAPLLLCDRTLLDHWAYTRVLFRDQLDTSERVLVSVLESFVKDYCSTYDAIFYLPIEFPPVDDGTREDDAGFQEAVASEIESLLARFGIPYTECRGSVGERAEIVLARLAELFKRQESIGGEP